MLLRLSMGKLMNKGFTLIEMLLVLMVVTILTLVFSTQLKLYEVEYFDPIQCQLKAMATRERCQFNSTIHFNQNGNINHAQTIKFHDKTCIFQLGMGRYRCE